MTLLIDTAVLIDGLRRNPDAIAFARNIAARPHVSVVSISELRAGQRGVREARDIDVLLANSLILDIDTTFAEISGELMRHYRKSHGLATPDALIAATAIHHRLELVTLNLKHFPMFPNLRRPY